VSFNVPVLVTHGLCLVHDGKEGRLMQDENPALFDITQTGVPRRDFDSLMTKNKTQLEQIAAYHQIEIPRPSKITKVQLVNLILKEWDTMK
jgi:hypothetical protein